ncbi:MAG: PKD domain-containing protein [Bacteroidales bacterium]|nr:PKD domain-containing protein [Bacteroidales bacterium]
MRQIAYYFAPFLLPFIRKETSSNFIIFDLRLCLFLATILISCSKQDQLPVPVFSFTNNQKGPVEVKFTNSSKFSEDYLWDFGDGKYSKEENPTNYYELPGFYTVSLRAINSEGSTTKKESITIKGISFYIVNYSSFTLTKAFAFYDDGNTFRLYGYGDIQHGYATTPAYTDKTSLYIGYKIAPDKFFIITNPFTLKEDTNNKLDVFIAAGITGTITSDSKFDY